MSLYTIAHISDLHLSPKHGRANIKNTKEVLDYLARLKVDHILVTGDLTDDAGPKEFELARNIFKSYELLDPARMSVIIGNHDIFGGIHLAEEILDFPRRCKKTPYHKKIHEFRKFFHELFEGCQFAINNEPFPYFKSLGDVLLIGLNSVAPYSAFKNPIGSNGRVAENHIKRVDEILSDGRLKHRRKIILIHHHFSKIKEKMDGTMHSIWGTIENQTMKLRGKRELLNLIRKHSINLVVHGHNHENKEYIRKGIKFLNGGGTLLNANSPQLFVNIIRITSAGIETECQEIHSVIDPVIQRVLSSVDPALVATADI